MKADQIIRSMLPPGHSAVANIMPKASSIRGRAIFQDTILHQPDTAAVFYQFVGSLHEKVKSIQTVSATHKFLRQLRDRGQLIRCYTQNIDSLELREGLSSIDTHSPADCDVIPLHGSLQSTRCTVCSYTANWTDEGIQSALLGQLRRCPQCMSRSRTRRAAGKRQHACGDLRPDILLYGESHPHETLPHTLLRQDLKKSPTLLLVIGTSLRIPGCRDIIRTIANKLHQNDNQVVYINHDPPSKRDYGTLIDVWISQECDDWVARVHQHWDTADSPEETGKSSSSVSSLGRLDDASPKAGTGSKGALAVINHLDRYDGYETRWLAAWRKLR